MPRGQIHGYVYHVINRGSDVHLSLMRKKITQSSLDLLSSAKCRHQVKVFGFCLLSNHFHILLEPETVDALSRFMHGGSRVTSNSTADVMAAVAIFGRAALKAFRFNKTAILTVLRYVLRNLVRASLVADPDQ